MTFTGALQQQSVYLPQTVELPRGLLHYRRWPTLQVGKFEPPDIQRVALTIIGSALCIRLPVGLISLEVIPQGIQGTFVSFKLNRWHHISAPYLSECFGFFLFSSNQSTIVTCQIASTAVHCVLRNCIKLAISLVYTNESARCLGLRTPQDKCAIIHLYCTYFNQTKQLKQASNLDLMIRLIDISASLAILLNAKLKTP